MSSAVPVSDSHINIRRRRRRFTKSRTFLFPNVSRHGVAAGVNILRSRHAISEIKLVVIVERLRSTMNTRAQFLINFTDIILHQSEYPENKFPIIA